MATKPAKGKKKGSGGNKGNQKAAADSKQKYDVAKAMIKSEKKYDELMTEQTKAFIAADEWENQGKELDITTEYMISARCKPGSSAVAGAACDWIPVAQICVVRPSNPSSVHVHGNSDEETAKSSIIRTAVSYYCREINYAATLASPSTFKSLPRNIIEYSAEPIDSFMKFVYEDVIQGKSADSYMEGDTKISLTKSKSREILGLDVGCTDAALIKSAYKKQSMALHPDRFVNSDKSQEEIDGMSARFGLVKMAYEALNSGVRTESVAADGSNTMQQQQQQQQSWYSSLGGKSRTDFSGAIDLVTMSKASALANDETYFKSAITGIDPELTMSFVARNQAYAAR